MAPATNIYDSWDPNHPNLPHLDIIDDSSCEEYNFSEDDSTDFPTSSSDSESGATKARSSDPKRKYGLKNRKVSFFGAADSSTSSFAQGDVTRANNLALEEQQQRRIANQTKKARKYYDSKTSSSSARLRANWEPGITPSTNVSLHSIGSAITITDYSETRYRVEHLEVPTIDNDTNRDDPVLLTKIKKVTEKLLHILRERPTWSKVRWVNVNGLSWEAISVISSFFQLHRLSIEDMVDIPQRTKVDQYANYTMCIMPLVKLVKLKRDAKNLKLSQKLLEMEVQALEASPYSSPMLQAHEHTPKGDSKTKHKKTITEQISEREMRRVSDWSSETTSRRKIRLLEVHRPLSYRNLSVGIEQVSLFILKGTVVSFFENSATDIESAILTRLSTEETILRDSCDPSILLQSIIDSIVDLAYPIVTAYRRRLEEVQADILTDAKIGNINELYLMLDELSLLKKNISPITTLVISLRDHAKKAGASAAVSASASASSDELAKLRHSSSSIIRPIFISDVCELYLSDVADHTASYTDDIQIMESMVNNLTSMIFNMTAAQQNNSMSYLSLVSVIFLPLMFWSSYYGMNFETFGDLKKDVAYYWKVSISFTAVFIILICWNYFVRFFRSWYKVIKRWRREYLIYQEIRRRRKEKEAKKLIRKQRSQRANSANIV